MGFLEFLDDFGNEVVGPLIDIAGEAAGELVEDVAEHPLKYVKGAAKVGLTVASIMAGPFGNNINVDFD